MTEKRSHTAFFNRVLILVLITISVINHIELNDAIMSAKGQEAQSFFTESHKSVALFNSLEQKNNHLLKIKMDSMGDAGIISLGLCAMGLRFTRKKYGYYPCHRKRIKIIAPYKKEVESQNLFEYTPRI